MVLVYRGASKEHRGSGIVEERLKPYLSIFLRDKKLIEAIDAGKELFKTLVEHNTYDEYAAHFISDAIVAVTKKGLRGFLKAQDGEKGMGSYEEPLVTIEMLGLLGMPRRDDILKFFKEMSEDISVYEHKASHSSYYCYADMADALRRIYEKERTAYRSYI